MENLKLLRKNAGKTQQEMADILKTTYRTYQNYESDVTEMPYASLIVAADYFGCSIDYLLGHQSNNIVHLDSFTTKEKVAIDLIRELDDDQLTILLGYLARMTNTSLDEVQRKLEEQ